MDNSAAVTCRSLPDLKTTQNRASKGEKGQEGARRSAPARVGGAAYLRCRTDPACRAPLRSSQSPHSYQTPGRDTSSATSAAAAAAARPSPTCPQTHRRNIFRGKLVGGVRDEQAGFTHSTVTHDNTLDGLHGCVSHSSLLIHDLQQKESQSKKDPKAKDADPPRRSERSAVTAKAPAATVERPLGLEEATWTRSGGQNQPYLPAEAASLTDDPLSFRTDGDERILVSLGSFFLGETE